MLARTGPCERPAWARVAGAEGGGARRGPGARGRAARGGGPPPVGPLLWVPFEPLALPVPSLVRGGPGSFGEPTGGSLARAGCQAAVGLPTSRHYVASVS